ncbi:MAG TPA: hypothetical protein EYQ50_06810 [Verrucomicrobiales bacterium]|nr:hypothetical protein [Verrucomicrobiales bacterium]HIL71266.1 hypothetical protein [Verrucomicrobiota bacterium]
MTPLDWSLVIGLNLFTICVGIVISRGAKNSSEWFLAGRTLGWWTIGLSLYATAIDASDLVADSGGVYTLGLTYFVYNWVGNIFGWLLAAHVVTLVMYRQGMYTNAEYLEARFGPMARIISALVQIQYRTMVLGIIANTLYLTLTIVCDWDQGAWLAVGVIAFIATLYTMWGGLKSVVITDALQSVVMITAAVILLITVWREVGGWEGAAQKLKNHEVDLPNQILRVGHDQVEAVNVSQLSHEEIDRLLSMGGEYDPMNSKIVKTTPAWLVCLAFIIAGMSYAIVNHTQSMRLLGAKSEWDLKMAVVLASAIILVATFLNLMVGIFGRALIPDPSLMNLSNPALQTPDSIYPLLVRDLLPVGLKGLVVAGILAASFSTFDSIGSTLSALITRDLYARLIYQNGSDRHYLKFGRWLTPVIIFGSLGYIPFLQGGGMLLFYLDLVGAIVVPLLTVYLMGTMTCVHRRTGTMGLIIGVSYGVLRLVTPVLVARWGWSPLPPIMLNGFAAYPFSLLATAIPMLIASSVWGWQSPQELRIHESKGWLAKSSEQISTAIKLQTTQKSHPLPLYLGMGLLCIGIFLSFYVFW